MAAASDRDSVLSRITKQKNVRPALCRIIDRFGENYKQILQAMGSDERLQKLQIKHSWTGRTILHLAVSNPGAETVEMILECVSEEERYILLSVQDRDNFTPIHFACLNDNSRVLDLMIRLFKEETRYKLLQITSASGSTPLHWSALRGHTQAISTIADSLTAQHLHHLLGITDDYGKTPLRRAQYGGKLAAADLLQDYQTKALIDVALKQTDQTGSNSIQISLLYLQRLEFPRRPSTVFDYSFYGV